MKKIGLLFLLFFTIPHFCQENHLEPDSVKGLVTPPLKEKIRAEAIGLRFLKGSTAKLPI